MPELPAARRRRMENEYAVLSAYDLDVLTASAATADYFEHVARAANDGKTAATWVMGEVMATLKSTGTDIRDFTVRPRDLASLIDLVKNGTVSYTAAKQIFGVMVATGDPPAGIADREGLLKVGDDAQLARWVDEVLAEHPDEARRFASGERKLLGVLVGLAMKKSGGRADPKKLNQLLAARAGT
jgi:aspartyl-tRNA(Asn)/glutamyl-tRNA(Gln) amidotransferase subunit B